jgi:putative effector of murein hydrolase LrgA (UPF0299 family)
MIVVGMLALAIILHSKIKKLQDIKKIEQEKLKI